MATKVHMEALSPTMEEGQIVSWLKNEGDEVADGDVLAEIETDKATMELVARGSGVLRKRFLGEGATAPVGSVIGVIADADEDISAIEAEAGGAGAPAAAAQQADEAQDEEADAAEDADAGATEQPRQEPQQARA
ncbi:MAG: lipoyl domain-containing protein, partial [Longimicrobiales bacterium]